MKVLAVNGSARKDGNTAMLLNLALEELKKDGIETELYQLHGKKINGCIACYKCFETKDKTCAQKGDCVNELIEKMLAADGMLLGSPVYFADMTAGMKALCERAGMVARANKDMLKYKAGASVVAVRRAGAIHAYDSLNHFFGISGMFTVGSIYWNTGIGKNIGDVEKDEEGVRTMQELGKNMAWLLKKIHG